MVNDRQEPEDEEPHFPCERCGEEHPVDVLEDGLCPVCVDID